ncbi:MAG: hypothetical protein QNK26_11875 [Moritella sp.]|uniref:PulJ/GspJ family protein n=1 Tax=Moritella sp. TaxID=78556 RepID=UPI0029B19AF4|nr:hypothetical protein [Moritella sp.]MDX2321277.1 hypothetical protein [Moritella sp.]
MISITLGIIVFMGIWRGLANQKLHSLRAEQYYLIQHEAQNMLTIMQRELSRAGYSANTETAAPFVYNSQDIYRLNSNQDCVTYRYDRNEDGLFSGEDFGFRLHNESLQLRKGSDVDCDGGLGWETISDAASMSVTLLRFRVSQQIVSSQIGSTPKMKAYVTIELSIRHRQLPDVELSFSRNSSARVLL